MNIAKLKDSLNSISTYTGNIQRYLHNGGANTQVVYEDLDNIEGEINRIERLINERKRQED